METISSGCEIVHDNKENIIPSSSSSSSSAAISFSVKSKTRLRNKKKRSGNGFVGDAWGVFYEMRRCGFVFTQFTFGGLLSCECLEVWRGMYLYGLIVKSGLLYVDAFAGTALLGCFGWNGCLDEVIRVFEDMPNKSLVTWNSVISLFGHYGFGDDCIVMFRELMRIRVSLSLYSFVGVLSGFVREEDLESGEQIHGLMIKYGLCNEVSVVNALLNMYVKCSSIDMAETMFDEMQVRDVVSWNTIIGVLARSDRPGKALECFRSMNKDETLPSQTTFVSVINSCTVLKRLYCGESIHALLIRKRYEFDVFVGSSLVDFYAKCGRMGDAHRCFDEIQDKNAVSWNSLMLGYSNASGSTSVFLLRQMIRMGNRPNEGSFSTVLRVSFKTELQQLHSLLIKMGYDDNEYVLSSLVSSYAKNGLIDDALTFAAETNMMLPVVPSNVIAGIFNRTGQYHLTQKLYSLLKEPDNLSWNILITACSRNGDYKEVFELFGQMKIYQVRPDKYTYISLLSVCTRICNLDLGRSLHGLIIQTDYDTFVGNILIDMYGKCGSLDSSIKIFDEMKDKNVISWTTVMSSLELHGRAYEAVKKFREMEILGFLPDEVAFVAALSVCRRIGLVKEGLELFEQMKSKYKIKLEMDHYILMVDLLARYGHLKEAEQLITRMPFPPNARIWQIFLDGCQRQRHAEDLALHI
ncbi:Pentatricopeptide repeat-containing protein [Heracleum sosnowskyi]|uniref:Pentatricopeptide repeat-containing protein n=1 Tax=Heracleum sosnowskyi TaxID=360622 RepID=A0AAD8JK63_9APIA|nr:Pentatricopeptide repeat-containing protein [Heracleum sosnowskyi]